MDSENESDAKLPKSSKEKDNSIIENNALSDLSKNIISDSNMETENKSGILTNDETEIQENDLENYENMSEGELDNIDGNLNFDHPLIKIYRSIDNYRFDALQFLPGDLIVLVLWNTGMWKSTRIRMIDNVGQVRFIGSSGGDEHLWKTRIQKISNRYFGEWKFIIDCPLNKLEEEITLSIPFYIVTEIDEDNTLFTNIPGIEEIRNEEVLYVTLPLEAEEFIMEEEIQPEVITEVLESPIETIVKEELTPKTIESLPEVTKTPETLKLDEYTSNFVIEYIENLQEKGRKQANKETIYLDFFEGNPEASISYDDFSKFLDDLSKINDLFKTTLKRISINPKTEITITPKQKVTKEVESKTIELKPEDYIISYINQLRKEGRKQVNKEIIHRAYVSHTKTTFEYEPFSNLIDQLAKESNYFNSTTKRITIKSIITPVKEPKEVKKEHLEKVIEIKPKIEYFILSTLSNLRKDGRKQVNKETIYNSYIENNPNVKIEFDEFSRMTDLISKTNEGFHTTAKRITINPIKIKPKVVDKQIKIEKEIDKKLEIPVSLEDSIKDYLKNLVASGRKQISKEKLYQELKLNKSDLNIEFNDFSNLLDKLSTQSDLFETTNKLVRLS